MPTALKTKLYFLCLLIGIFSFSGCFLFRSKSKMPSEAKAQLEMHLVVEGTAQETEHYDDPDQPGAHVFIKMPEPKNKKQVSLRYGKKYCDLRAFTRHSHNKLKGPIFGGYECFIPDNELEADMPIEAAYRRPDGTTVTLSVRWPGPISDIQIQELMIPEEGHRGLFPIPPGSDAKMTLSWKLPEKGRPDAILVLRGEPPEYDVIPHSRWFTREELRDSETLSGDAVSHTHFERGAYLIHLTPRKHRVYVTSIATGTVSPLLNKKSSARAYRPFYREILVVSCKAEDIDPTRRYGCRPKPAEAEAKEGIPLEND